MLAIACLFHGIGLGEAGAGALQAASSWESHNTGHGREEWRRCWAFDAGDRLYKGDQWRDLQSFALVERTRRIGDRTSVELRYYISSLAPDAEKFMRAVRSHWEVENRLHWCLDVQFGDDYAPARTGHVAHNLALVRDIALNLIRLNTSVKTSIKRPNDCWLRPRMSFGLHCWGWRWRVRTTMMKRKINVVWVASGALAYKFGHKDA